MKVNNKVFVVTGAGGGLGRELTLKLINKNAKVAALDVNEKGLKETQELCKNKKENIAIFTMDITNKKEIELLPVKIIKKFKQADGLINNAGVIQPFVKVSDLGYDKIDKIMKINFFGALYLIKTFLPHFMKRPEAHIVNISSMGGFFPFPGQTIYGASKAAVKILTEGLYSELLETNVRVTAVFPGAMATNIAANSGLKMNGPGQEQSNGARALSPAKAADIIINGVENNAFQIFVGPDAKFMNLFYKINPRYAVRYIYKKMKNLIRQKP